MPPHLQALESHKVVYKFLCLNPLYYNLYRIKFCFGVLQCTSPLSIQVPSYMGLQYVDKELYNFIILIKYYCLWDQTQVQAALRYLLL